MQVYLPEADSVTRAEQGVPMTVLGLHGRPLAKPDGTPVTITLLGGDSKRMRDKARDNVRKRVERGANQGSTEEMMAAADADAIDYLVAAAINWDGFATKEGKEVPMTPENVAGVFAAFPTIRDQSEAFINDRTRFMLASSTA